MYNNKEKSTKLSQQSYKNFRDEELIFKIVEENQLAFKELFVRYALKVKFLMLKMGTKELDAEEITQEVMLSLWRKANTYDTEKASAATWVFTIARNHRIDLFRKSSRLKIDPLDPTFVPEPDLNPVQLLIKSQKKDRIRKIIGNLRNDQKELLMAAFFEGLAHPELAKRFDKPLGTIKSRLRLIYESLRKEENLLTLKGSDGYEN